MILGSRSKTPANMPKGVPDRWRPHRVVGS